MKSYIRHQPTLKKIVLDPLIRTDEKLKKGSKSKGTASETVELFFHSYIVSVSFVHIFMYVLQSCQVTANRGYTVTISYISNIMIDDDFKPT